MKKLILLQHKELPVSFYFSDDTLIEFDLEAMQDGSEVGQIFIGKVKNILPNIQAAFVEYQKGKLGFLPLSDYEWSQKTLKQSMELPVQILKAAVKTKNPVLTTKLSITGEYSVVNLGDNRIGYSNKLSVERKSALKASLDSSLKLLIQNMHSEQLLIDDIKNQIGIVIRTNAKDEAVSFKQILEEASKNLEELVLLLAKSQSRTIFTRLSKNDSFFTQKCKQYGISELDEVITDTPSIYQELWEYFAANHYDSVKLKLYEDEAFPLSALYSLSKKAEEAYAHKVWLKSGGFLVIDETEALTVMDVNSGKNITGKDKEKTFVKIN